MSGQLPTREEKALRRLLPRLESRFASASDPVEWEQFTRRVREHFPRLFGRLFELYSSHYDFFYYLESALSAAAEMWMERPQELKALDALRESDPFWYQNQRLVGAMCYVDLFAQPEDETGLEKLRERIPYLTEMGITYLHLMPIFKSPEGDNDGGYAISSYRETNPSLGTMAQLRELATELRHHGISLVLDFVFNHTSDEHEWARKALSGDPEFQEYYYMYPDRTVPEAYEASLGEVFPDEHPGAFTYRSRIGKWVWTTFYNYQWDLNYQNPEVFVQMLREMLFLANQGVEVLRMDAVAFIWKKVGTNCQNLPQAHWLLQAFNAAVAMSAPAMVFKSEAIVHPDEVRKYVRADECQLSYNPQLMALLWNALATREVRLLETAMRRRFSIPRDCEWVNYVRSHDDIGWAISDEDITAVGFDCRDHRRFLTNFYTGKFADSFSRGLPFQIDPRTGDGRVSGTTASLAGLEEALELEDEELTDLAVKRILLLHGVIMTIGGIPLIYLGDELATLNDRSFATDPVKAGDSRWVHRGKFDWERVNLRRDRNHPVGRVYQGLLRLIQLRCQNLAFGGGPTEFIDTGNPHVFGYFRDHEDHGVMILANFTESPQRLEGRRLRLLGLRRTVVDQISGQTITAAQEMLMAPYQFVVLARNS
ncbi:amylosucrase [Planctomycetaceae bacterium SH139]|jgi:amylosucrase/maltose alpha-D-glucosyltransferase/alpha-amylase